MYDRLSVCEEIGFTVLFLLKRKNKRLPQIIFLSLYGHENEVYNSMPLLLWCKRLIMCGVLVNAEG